MTIQFNYPWNGHDGIKTLAPAEEARLVAQGVARVYVPPVQLLNVQAVRSASGAITGLQAADGQMAGGGVLARLASQLDSAHMPQPLLALDDWTTGQTVRGGYAIKTAAGNEYMYTASGVTGAVAPAYVGLQAIADGTATAIYVGKAPAASASRDVPAITFGARPAAFVSRHNPITQPQKFIFSGGVPVVSTDGKGVLMAAYTSKTVGNVVVTTPGKYGTNGAFEFMTDAPIFYLNDAGYTLGVSMRFVVEVDGVLLKNAAIMGSGAGSMVFDFSAYPPKARRIRINWISAAAAYYFEGVWTERGYSVWAPEKGVTAAVIGTSLTEGSGYSSFTSGLGWPDYFARMGGFRVMHNLAQGSSALGLSTGTRFSWIERAQDIFDVAPDVLFVEGPHNDASLPAAVQRANNLQFLSMVRTALPSTLIVCFGTNAEVQSKNPAMIATETEMEAAVSEMADSMVWFVPVMTDPAGPWFAGYRHGGNIIAMTTGANAQFTLSTAPTCAVGDSVVPYSITGAVGANGLIGHVTGVAGNVVTTDINTTGAGAFTGPSGYMQINDLYTSQDGVHPVQSFMSVIARRYLEALRRRLAAAAV